MLIYDNLHNYSFKIGDIMRVCHKHCNWISDRIIAKQSDYMAIIWHVISYRMLSYDVICNIYVQYILILLSEL